MLAFRVMVVEGSCTARRLRLHDLVLRPLGAVGCAKSCVHSLSASSCSSLPSALV